MRKKILVILVTGICLFVICIGGCSMATARGYKKDNPFLEKGRLQFEDVWMSLKIHVDRIDTTRVGDGLLKVIMTLKNQDTKPLWVDVRTIFLDGNNHLLEETNWEPIFLEAKTFTEYSCTSLGRDAKDYQIIIKKPKSEF